MEFKGMLLFLMIIGKIAQNRPQVLGKKLQFSCSNISCMAIGADGEFGTCFNMHTVSNSGVIQKPKRAKKLHVKFPKLTERLFLDLIRVLIQPWRLEFIPSWLTWLADLRDWIRT